jgi:hypothetical protein
MGLFHVILQLLLRVMKQIASPAGEVIFDIMLTQLVVVLEVDVAFRAVVVSGVVDPVLTSSMPGRKISFTLGTPPMVAGTIKMLIQSSAVRKRTIAWIALPPLRVGIK